MEKERQGISCDLARELDIVNYLDSVGIKPARIKGYDYWYHSPFREERTPSFKVNRNSIDSLILVKDGVVISLTLVSGFTAAPFAIS